MTTDKILQRIQEIENYNKALQAQYRKNVAKISELKGLLNKKEEV